MIRNILFDLDDTLLDFKKAERHALRKTLAAYRIEPSDENIALYSRINASQWKLLEKGELDRSTLKVRRFSLFSEALGLKLNAESLAASYETNRAIGHFFIDGAPELLKALYGHYRLYIVTNGFAHVQRSRLASAKIESLFDGIFISQEIGAEKPSPAFFNACFARIPNFSKNETLLIGDSLTSDIKGGLQAGITTVFYAPHGQIPHDNLPHYTIMHLSELTNILQTL